MKKEYRKATARLIQSLEGDKNYLNKFDNFTRDFMKMAVFPRATAAIIVDWCKSDDIRK